MTRPDPELKTVAVSVDTTQGQETVTGVLLGKGSSRRRTHTHASDQPVPPGRRCSACRWMVVSILYDSEAEQYVVVTNGQTRVPGETERGHVERTTSAVWVIECLQLPDRHSKTGGMYLPYTSRKAITTAARFDADIADAWNARQNVVV